MIRSLKKRLSKLERNVGVTDEKLKRLDELFAAGRTDEAMVLACEIWGLEELVGASWEGNPPRAKAPI